MVHLASKKITMISSIYTAYHQTFLDRFLQLKYSYFLLLLFPPINLVSLGILFFGGAGPASMAMQPSMVQRFSYTKSKKQLICFGIIYCGGGGGIHNKQ